MQYLTARPLNSTLTSLPKQVPTVTAPAVVFDTTSNSAFNVRTMPGYKNGQGGAAHLIVLPYATAADGNTGKQSLVGWGQFGDLWIPTTIGTITATFSSNFPGVDNHLIPSSMLFAGGITNVAGDTTIRKLLLGAATLGISGYVVDLSQLPFDWFQIDGSNESSATDINALIGVY